MLLDSESPKYLGNEEGLLNIELMRKLYHVIAFNLAKLRAAQDGNNYAKEHYHPRPNYWNLGGMYWSETTTQKCLNLST